MYVILFNLKKNKSGRSRTDGITRTGRTPRGKGRTLKKKLWLLSGNYLQLNVF